MIKKKLIKKAKQWLDNELKKLTEETAVLKIYPELGWTLEKAQAFLAATPPSEEDIKTYTDYLLARYTAKYEELQAGYKNIMKQTH